MNLRIALRNLSRNRQRTFATAGAVLIGAAALVFADAWVRGIGEAIRQYAASSRLGALQIHGEGYMARADALPLDLTVPADEATLDELAKVEGVTGVTPRILFTGTASNGREQTMVLGTAIDPVREPTVCPGFLESDLEEGRLLQEDDEMHAIVGTGLARSLRLKTGSLLTVEARTGGGRMNALDLEVVGVASSSLPDEAKWLLVIPIGAAQRLVQLDGKGTALVLSVEDMDRAEAVGARVRAAVQGRPLEVHTWREVGLFFEQAIKTFAFAQGFLMVILAILVVLVIANAAAMTAAERAMELATMMAIGARRADVRRLFLTEAALLGVLASVLGAALGAAVAALASENGVPFRPPNQPEVLVFPYASLSFAVQAVAFATAACVVGTFVPAWSAARRAPAEVLRP